MTVKSMSRSCKPNCELKIKPLVPTSENSAQGEYTIFTDSGCFYLFLLLFCGSILIEINNNNNNNNNK